MLEGRVFKYSSRELSEYSSYPATGPSDDPPLKQQMRNLVLSILCLLEQHDTSAIKIGIM